MSQSNLLVAHGIVQKQPHYPCTKTNLCAVEQTKAVLLIFLALSVAFDAIEHQILRSRLQKLFCVVDSALEWFSSYFWNYKLLNPPNDENPEETGVQLGVPQGSLLGPHPIQSRLVP